ncbi:DUF998 domain-containing protein [Flagellimonas sp. DF-77]|uniref:DUF998 domain-containing protein n=1 Tax=Flagellimonas algarum TaxID=3230298 RepID=UPI00339A9527
MKPKEKQVGWLGLLAPTLLLLALLVFGSLNPEFRFQEDFISKLGAQGAPNALGFNLIGFGAVGILLTGFGFGYGRLLHDRLLAILLAFFGIGFAFTGLPIDFEEADSAVSKAHIVAICLGLAAWLFGLSRLGANHNLEPRVRKRANRTAVLLVLAIIGFVAGLWSMPMTHRLVFLVVFGWTAITAVKLLKP